MNRSIFICHFFLMLILFLQHLINEILGVGRKVSSVQSVTQSCLTLYDSMDCKILSFPAHHQLQEFTQTHVHPVDNAIQPPHPVSSLSPPAFSLSQYQDIYFQMSQFFASSDQSIGASASASILPVNIQDWFPLGWTGWISLQSKGFSRVSSNTIVQKHQFFGAQLSW